MRQAAAVLVLSFLLAHPAAAQDALAPDFEAFLHAVDAAQVQLQTNQMPRPSIPPTPGR